MELWAGLMEQTVCSACGRQMTLKDLENNSFSEVDGKMYCPQCFLKIGHPRKMRCPNCGRETTALLRNGVYTCIYCGEKIGGRQESGVIASARPSAGRDSTVRRPAAAAPRPLRPQKDRKVQVLAVALSGFAAASLILAALLVRAHFSRDAEPSQPAAHGEEQKQPVRPEPKSKDAEALQRVQNWVKENPEKIEQGIKLYNQTIQDMTDPVFKARTRIAVIALQTKLEQADRVKQGKLEQLTRELEEAREQIQNLKTRLEKASRAPAPKEAQPPAPRTTETAPKTTPAEKRAREAAAAFQDALGKAQKQQALKQYGQAMKTMQAFADNYQHTEYGGKAEDKCKTISRHAYGQFGTLRKRADVLVEQGDYTGARQLYASALGFGVPDITGLVEQCLAEIRRLEENQVGATAKEPTPPAVKRQIEALSSEDKSERAEAARRLGDLGDPAAVLPLIEALKDEDSWNVRACAAKSLGKLGEISAVPALIDALGDKSDGVAFDAHNALKAITGEQFSRAQRAKWLAWYKENKVGAQRPAPKPVQQKGSSAFTSTVIERRYDPDTVSFVVPEGKTLAAGTNVKLLRDGDHICNVLIQQVAGAQAFGELSGLQHGAEVAPGDKITVQPPE